MKKHHGVLWYIMVFPFIAPFYIVYYMFLFSIYTILFIIQLPFQIFRIAFYQVARLLKIPTTSEKSVSSGLEYEQYCVDYLNKHGLQLHSFAKIFIHPHARGSNFKGNALCASSIKIILPGNS